MSLATTSCPNYAELDRGIRPLVKAINSLGLMTSHSCEGHPDGSRGVIQSAYPKVIISSGSINRALPLLRLIGMLGIRNTHHEHGMIRMRWALVPIGNPSSSLSLQPSGTHLFTLKEMHEDAILLARNLRRMNKWYQLK